MSKAKTQQLEPRVVICERTEHMFLIELERLILAGYRVNLNEQFAMLPACMIATLDLPA